MRKKSKYSLRIIVIYFSSSTIVNEFTENNFYVSADFFQMNKVNEL
jgi:hypothetical protein